MTNHHGISCTTRVAPRHLVGRCNGATDPDVACRGRRPGPRSQQSTRRNHLHEMGGPPAVPPTPSLVSSKASPVTASSGSFNAEVLWRQASVNGHVAGLEVHDQVVDGDRSFTALSGAGRTRRASACSTASSWLGGEPARGCTSAFSGISSERQGPLRGGAGRQKLLRGNPSTSGAATKGLTSVHRANATGCERDCAASLLGEDVGRGV